MFGSGLPVEFEGDARELAAYDPRILSRVNFDRGRMRPSYSVDVSAGATVWKHEQRDMRLQVNARNLMDHLNVINFAGLVSGTAIAAPRSYTVSWRAEF